VSGNVPPLDGEGERLWFEVTAVFGDPARHDRFIAHCAKEGFLPAAARRYRDWSTAHPDDAVSPKMIQRITFLALQPMAQPRAQVSRRFRPGLLLAVIAVAAVAGALFGMFGGHRGVTP